MVKSNRYIATPGSRALRAHDIVSKTGKPHIYWDPTFDAWTVQYISGGSHQNNHRCKQAIALVKHLNSKLHDRWDTRTLNIGAWAKAFASERIG